MEQSLNIKQVTPFFMVTSMEASLRFYVEGLALYHEFLAKGITPREPFVGNNMWDVALTDPTTITSTSKAQRTSPKRPPTPNGAHSNLNRPLRVNIQIAF